MNKARRHQPHEYFTNDDGRQLVRLVVDAEGTTAITEAVLWDNAVKRHKLTGTIYMTGKKDKKQYAMASIVGKGTHNTLIRLLLNPTNRCPLLFKDGNPLNLLPENIDIGASWADDELRAKMMAGLVEEARKPYEVTHADE